MVQLQRLLRAVGVLDAAFDWLTRRHLLQADQADTVVLPDAVIIGPVLKGQGEQPLLLQIGFVDAGKAAGDDRRAAQKPRRQRSVLPAAAFAVIVVADRHPACPVRLVIARDLADRLALLAAQYVDPGSRLAVEGVG